MAITDLVSSGASPITAPTSSGTTTETVLPDWYTNYAMQLLSNQQALSNQPLAMFPGPRVADFTPMQQQGFQQTQQAATAYQPALSAATQATQNVLGISPSQMAQPYLSAASQAPISNISAYMNPYTSDVVNQIAALANQNLTQNIMPQIGSEFTAAGQFGSSRNAEVLGRAIANAQVGISNAQAQALQSGFQNALTAAQNQQAQQAQLAQLAAGLGTQDVSTQLAAAQQLGAQGAQAQALGLEGAGALQQAGATQQALNQQNLTQAYQDFLTQQGYPQQQINNMLATLQGVKGAVPTGGLSQTAGTSIAGYTPSTLAQVLGTLSTLGSTQGQTAIGNIANAGSSVLNLLGIPGS